ncbi:MAG: response regulator [Chitinophagaceae bacterium]
MFRRAVLFCMKPGDYSHFREQLEIGTMPSTDYFYCNAGFFVVYRPNPGLSNHFSSLLINYLLQMPNALIIDDETDIWILLSNILRKHNLRTYYVNNLEAATKRLKQEVPSIIFLDNHLPDGFGLDFIQFIKRHYPATKIVMITGYDLQSDRNRALSEGADLFISKPFSSDIINDTIKKLL